MEVKSKRKTKGSKKKNRVTGQQAGLITQASILQHLDKTLIHWLKPLNEKVARIEQSMVAVVQKMDRIEHHLNMAPNAQPKQEPATMLAPPSGMQLPPPLTQSMQNIGSLPPPVGQGSGMGLPNLVRGVSDVPPGVHTNFPGMPALPLPFPPLPFANVQDLTGPIPEITGISRQKSNQGYAAYGRDGG